MNEYNREKEEKNFEDFGNFDFISPVLIFLRHNTYDFNMSVKKRASLFMLKITQHKF